MLWACAWTVCPFRCGRLVWRFIVSRSLATVRLHFDFAGLAGYACACASTTDEAATVHADITADHRDIPAALVPKPFSSFFSAVAKSRTPMHFSFHSISRCMVPAIWIHSYIVIGGSLLYLLIGTLPMTLSC